MSKAPGLPNPAELPIYELAAEIAAALTDGDGSGRLVLQAPTGSGKSTQVPQILLDHGVLKRGESVLVLQPRRLAARLLGNRVAAERRGRVGDEVGYQVRFENRTGAATRIHYLTEGILVRRLLDDADLMGIGAVVFDEFHERHLQADLALAIVLRLQQERRPDLKIVVMSATLDTAVVEKFLQPCTMLSSEGRTFPVECTFVPLRQKDEVWDAVVRAMEERVLKPGREGDVLVFMPGAFEIRKTMEAIARRPWSKEFLVLPLYGELPPDKQDAAVSRQGRRKIVVATNVAETSVTIDGVCIVIDSGLARVADYDARRGINTLTVQKISRASAEQRSGRAGRTAPGICLRLWSEADHARRDAVQSPEIHRLDLCEAALFLKANGYEDLAEFPWIDAPSPTSLRQAENLLAAMGAIGGRSAAITDVGRSMMVFPVHPRYARMLLAAREYGCVEEAALCVGICQGRGLFMRKAGKAADRDREAFVAAGDLSDFQPLLRAWTYAQSVRFDVGRCGEHGIHANAAREAGKIASDLLRSAGGVGGVDPRRDPEGLAKVILLGFSDHVAKRKGAGTLSCAVVGGRSGTLSKSSVAKDAALVVAAEIIEIEGRELNVMLNLATAVREEWLEELFPGELIRGDGAAFDPIGKRVINRKEVRFRDLVIESKHSGDVAGADAAAVILAEEVCAGRLSLKSWDAEVDAWIERVNCLAAWMPEIGVPEFGEEDRKLVIAEVCSGAIGYKDIKDRPVKKALQGWLSAAQRDLVERFAPQRVKLSNGRTPMVRYELGKDPTIALRLQHLYDVDELPRIAGGAVKVVVEILAPNGRPAQVTSDLAGFWQNSYPEVKKQLKGRYPKHEWR
jgi:ATP-dependent helicase HrpB